MTEVEGDLTAALFKEHGADEIPSSEVLITLVNPTVYCWKDEGTPRLKATVTASPAPQVVYSQNVDMSDRTIIGIESVAIDSDAHTLFAVSVDDGKTWWNYVSDTWVQLTENTSGQTREDIEAISTSAWADFAITGMIRFRFVLATPENYVTEIRINYLNTSAGEPTEKILQSLTVKTPPNKQIYVLGEAFDLTGISVVATYDTGLLASVTNGCKFSIEDGQILTTAGIQSVIVSYTESGITVTAEFTIDVKNS